MYYKPCGSCPIKKTCANREFIRNEIHIMNALDGINCTYLDFQCAERQALFTPGMRVSVTLTEWLMVEEEEHLGYGYTHTISVPQEGDVKIISATVMFWTGDKVQIWLDEPIRFHEWMNTRVKIRPNRLIGLEEPAIQVCPLCGKPKNRKNEESWNCDQCDNF
jgi:hypothetical protein